MLITILPLIVLSALIGGATYFQAGKLIEAETKSVEQRILDAKQQEIRHYISLALNSIERYYLEEPGGREVAKQEAKRILNNMAFGPDGYFFVYSMDGTNLVHPKLAHLIGKRLWDLQYPESDLGIRALMEAARRGGGFQEYIWHKPSTGLVEKKLSYGVLLPKWGWMLGTGLYIDDIAKEVEEIRTDITVSVRETLAVIFAITSAAIIVAGTVIAAVRLSEQRFADSKLKELTNRIFEVQEQERKRVSTELHDSISQLLVSVRYGVEMIHSEANRGSDLRGYAEKSLGILDDAISEVRRISRDLRPSVLDDMGLASALISLGKEFETQSAIQVDVSAQKCHDRLSDSAKTALYRLVQEALTNVARHSGATKVDINLVVGNDTLRLTIEDNGQGLPTPLPRGGGLGIRNMRERMETHNGFLQLSNMAKGGARILVTMPLDQASHRAA
ncbi:cache domain-containing protein [Roseibium sp.]|uniref:cache domain-containing protein n=1 Tax=Roseibium sp. TaxID=1936156 RepID=UPI003A97A478